MSDVQATPLLSQARSSHMVDISDEAAELIRTLVEDSDLPESAGLRLATDGDTHSLAMNLGAAPLPDDLVLEHAGASLFVSASAAPRLAEQTLHAQLEPRAAFFLDE
jgi:Fe-S cluster assembly iron-binding protein IscA